MSIFPSSFQEFAVRTHFVLTVHQFFFVQSSGRASGIYAIRIVEQAISATLSALPYMPKNGALALFGNPNVINQGLASATF
ncbi:hypothetical protein [Pseudomonas faucium]|uniref:hypothetical protein n=1 Tax=Pseudomonas faucium TaxID=2740518 RepID=UPI0039C355FA